MRQPCTKFVRLVHGIDGNTTFCFILLIAENRLKITLHRQSILHLL